MPTDIPEGLPQISAALLAMLRARGIRSNFDVLYTANGTLREYGATDDVTALSNIPGVAIAQEAVLRDWALRQPLTSDERARVQRALETALAREKRASAQPRAMQSGDEPRSSAGFYITCSVIGSILGFLIWRWLNR